MTDAQRQTYLKIGAAVCVGLFILNYVVLNPFLAAWSDQSQRIDALRQKVDRGQQLVDREDVIRRRWAQMTQENLPSEISAAENVAFQAIGRWTRASGINVASLTPSWQDHDEGYQTLEWRISATGTQASLARFMYEMESDAVPVNFDEYEVSTRDEHGSQLSMTGRFSFLQMPATGSGTP
jgi:Tfp pilus assembly protein PilO